MDEFTNDDEFWDEEESLSGDPFDGLTAGEQDLFFRMIDLLPDDIRTSGIEYFMENPKKIRAIVDNIKTGDQAALNALLEQERIVIEKIDQLEA